MNFTQYQNKYRIPREVSYHVFKKSIMSYSKTLLKPPKIEPLSLLALPPYGESR
jgi:hypothetical protein